MSYTERNGWFTKVNGHGITRRDLNLGSTTYTAGFPKGILWHYTAGCGSDISGTLKDRGISVTFSVDLEGRIFEYLPVAVAGWHAFEASHYFLGIEHTAYPGSCDLTDQQLVASADLAAAIIEWNQARNHFTIPTTHIGSGPASVGIADFRPGFLDHREGKPDWNENGHSDHLYRWSWGQYLRAVDNALEGDDMGLTEKQADALEFAVGVQMAAEGMTEPKDPGPRRRGYRWALGVQAGAATRAETQP